MPVKYLLYAWGSVRSHKQRMEDRARRDILATRLNLAGVKTVIVDKNGKTERPVRPYDICSVTLNGYFVGDAFEYAVLCLDCVVTYVGEYRHGRMLCKETHVEHSARDCYVELY